MLLIIILLIQNFPRWIYLSIFLLFLIYKWENKILFGSAIFFVVCCPILLNFNAKTAAEQIAIGAYYFLAMGIVLQLVEYIRESKIKKKQAVKQ